MSLERTGQALLPAPTAGSPQPWFPDRARRRARWHGLPASGDRHRARDPAPCKPRPPSYPRCAAPRPVGPAVGKPTQARQHTSSLRQALSPSMPMLLVFPLADRSEVPSARVRHANVPPANARTARASAGVHSSTRTRGDLAGSRWCSPFPGPPAPWPPPNQSAAVAPNPPTVTPSCATKWHRTPAHLVAMARHKPRSAGASGWCSSPDTTNGRAARGGCVTFSIVARTVQRLLRENLRRRYARPGPQTSSVPNIGISSPPTPHHWAGACLVSAT